MDSENIPLSEYLRRYSGLPSTVADYTERLEDAAMAGMMLAAQIRRFVSKDGAGKTAEDVEAALVAHDQAWDKLADTGGTPDQPINVTPIAPET